MIPRFVAIGPIFLCLLVTAGVLRGETKVGETWIRVDGRESETIKGFDVTGDRMVVAGLGGMLATSEDGDVWKQEKTHATTFNAVASGGGYHVAAGSGDSCYSSNDGEHWTRRVTGVGAAWNDVAWTGARFVMVGSGGSIVSSANGVDWSREASGTTQSLLDVTVDSGVVQVLAANGSILKSATQGSWQSTSPSLSFVSFAVRNGRTVAGGLGSSTGLRYLDDGGTWIKATIIKAGDSGTYFRSIASGPPGFVTVNEGGELLHSEDGSVWYQRILPILESPVAIQWTGSEFVGTTPSRRIVRSSDGKNWSADGMERGVDAVWSGSLHVVVGASGFIARSADGIHWTSSVSGTVNDLRGIAWNGTRFIATGELGTLLSSEDGIAWSAVPTGNWDHNGITWTGDRFIALASDGMILSSADGLI